ncbi:TPA: phage protein Gp27 family protein [Salmonella enterica subsp. enterica serovar Hvittingfoss]
MSSYGNKIPGHSVGGWGMGRFSTINALPEDIRNELNALLLKNNFGSHIETSEWLKAKGYPISRSAIARYCLSRRAEITAQGRAIDTDDYLHYRIKCLLAATQLHTSKIDSSSKDVLKDAQIFVDWLYE